MATIPDWLQWAMRLQAIAQNGLTFATDPFDVERYEAMREIAAEMMAQGAVSELQPVRDLLAKQSGYATPKWSVSEITVGLGGSFKTLIAAPGCHLTLQLFLKRTTKVDVRGVVFRDGGILLVKELADGGWTLPGGWVDVLEAPREAVVREVCEESGFQTRPVKLLAVYDRAKHAHVPPLPFHIYKLFIHCELTGGAAAASVETGGAAFFREDAIPELSISRTTPGQIARMFEHLRHPEWPADFD